MNRFFDHPRRQAGRLALAIGLGALLAATRDRLRRQACRRGGRDVRRPGAREPKAQKPVRLTPSEKLGVTLGTVPEVRLPGDRQGRAPQARTRWPRSRG